MKYTTFLALKYLKPTKKKIFSYISTIIAIFGIAIGVAALIVTLGIMTGFHNEIRSRLMKMYPHIIVTGSTDVPAEKVLKLKEVESGSPFIYSQAIIKSNNVVYTTIVKGVNLDMEEKVSGIKDIFIEKDKDELDNKEIFLGKELAQNLKVKLNDEIIMILPTQVHTPFGDLPMTEKFVIKGIFKSGIYEYDNNLCYIGYDIAKEIFYDKKNNVFNAVLGFGIRLKSDRYLDNVVKKIEVLLGVRHKVLSWEQLNYNLFSALKLEKVMMIIVISLIIIVACFIIVTNLIMMGIQKSKDIGILISMGANKKEIKKIFFIQGIILNISGIIAGTVLGLILSFLIQKYQFVKLPKEVYYIDTIPVYISVLDLATVLLITIVVGMLASLYPAKKVSQLDPIEIIRYG